MKKLALRSRQILFTVSNLEKKHKIITYASLLFLTISTYFLRSENQNIKINFATIQERNIHLKNNMIIFNRNYEGFPLPVWQKVKRGNEFIIQYVNPSYLDLDGVNDLYDIIGKNNFELFTKKMAQRYYENDIAVAITGNKLETYDEFIEVDGTVIKLKVLKWREIRENKDTLIYGMIKEIIK